MVNPQEKSESVTRWLVGEATEADLAVIARMDRVELGRQARLHAQLSVAFEGEMRKEQRLQSWIAAVRDSERERFVQAVREKVEISRWRLRALALACCLAIAAGMAWFSIRFMEPESYASVMRVENVSGPSDGVPAGRVFNQNHDHLVFHDGLVELDLAGRGSMVVEGPADLRFISADSAELKRGRIVMRATKKGIGYSLKTPRGRVVDLGTEFGVLVQDDGEVEAHVIDGEIEVLSGQSGRVKLKRAEALSIGAAGAKTMHADFGKFYTSMPPVSTSENYVLWDFDGDMSGAISSARIGGDLSPEGKEMNLKSMHDGPLPARVEGVRGSALHFDGNGAYAETAYRGVGGGKPRTVCFWIRVPTDFSIKQGFGVVSWGLADEARTPGTVWQVSVNPWEQQGPLGRIRVGVYRGQIIGMTDLRDGKWHHVGIVLFGGSRPDVGTHVMLYIDGKPERISGRSLREIRTEVDSAEHGIWLGRNLTYTDETDKDYQWGGFFRGDLDEVFVSERVLSQEEIIELKENGKNR